jgi:hypothetical protein
VRVRRCTGKQAQSVGEGENGLAKMEQINTLVLDLCNNAVSCSQFM